MIWMTFALRGVGFSSLGFVSGFDIRNSDFYALRRSRSYLNLLGRFLLIYDHGFAGLNVNQFIFDFLLWFQ
jgi:hypothetical protein